MKTERTGVLEVIGDGGTTVGSGLMGKEVSQGLLLVRADDGQGEVNQLGPGLARGAAGRRDVVEILLAVHEGEMELPELLRGDAGDLKEGRCHSDQIISR